MRCGNLDAMQAAIFDMDGLLIDSEPLWTRAEQEVFARLGIDLDDAQLAQVVQRAPRAWGSRPKSCLYRR